MNRCSSLALLATIAFIFGSAPSQVFAQETVVRTGVLFKIGKAFNRAFLANPKPKTNHLRLVDRVHYATDVYHYEGVASSNSDVLISRGCFIHIDIDDPKTIKLDHSLAK